MSSAEIDTFEARLHKFINKGLARNDGEVLADRLVLRDREQDDRRVCLECQHFAGHRAGSWRCGNWLRAGVATRALYAALPANLVNQLQRCAGFTLFSVGYEPSRSDCMNLLFPYGNMNEIGGVH